MKKLKKSLPWKGALSLLLILSTINVFIFGVSPISGIFLVFALSPLSTFFLFGSLGFAGIPPAIGVAYFYYFAVIFLFKWLKQKNKWLPWLFLLLFIVLDLMLGWFMVDKVLDSHMFGLYSSMIAFT